MSIKNLLCDIPEELQELLDEQLNDYDIEISSMRNELAETKAALVALQLKYDKKEHENKILVRGLKYHVSIKEELLRHIRNISLETAHAIHIGEQPLYIEKEKKHATIQKQYQWDTSYEVYSDISFESEILDEPKEDICSLQEEVNKLEKPKTFIDFNGVEQVKYNSFDQWLSDKWFTPIRNN